MGQLAGFDEANIEIALKNMPHVQMMAGREDIQDEAISIGSINQASDSDFTKDGKEVESKRAWTAKRKLTM